jgi:integrase
MKLRAELDYIQAFKNRLSGKVYYYYRRAGKRVPIKSEFGSAAFLRDVAEIENTFASKSETTRGTLEHLIEAYKLSPDYLSLKPATQLSYQRAFETLVPFNEANLRDFKRASIIEMRDWVLLPKYRTWMANYAVSVLSIIFRFGHDHGLMESNPLRERVRKIRAKDKQPANRPWTAVERQIVLENAPNHVLLPIALAMCTGLRKADIFSITTSAISNGQIIVKTSKRGVSIKLPVHRILAIALERRPKVDTLQIAVRSDGKPWTADGFDTVWHKLKKRLEGDGKIEKGLTLHGLRHTLGTLLKEAGAGDGEIADVLGQSTTAMARHYSRDAGLSDKMQNVVMGLELVTNRSK